MRAINSGGAEVTFAVQTATPLSTWPARKPSPWPVQIPSTGRGLRPSSRDIYVRDDTVHAWGRKDYEIAA